MLTDISEKSSFPKLAKNTYHFYQIERTFLHTPPNLFFYKWDSPSPNAFPNKVFPKNEVNFFLKNELKNKTGCKGERYSFFLMM